MSRLLLPAFVLGTACLVEAGEKVTLMDDASLEAIRSTVSGALAKSHVRELTQMHRVQATAGYHQAAEYIRERAVAYGLQDVEIVKLPADGEALLRPLQGLLWLACRGWTALGGLAEKRAHRRLRRNEGRPC